MVLHRPLLLQPFDDKYRQVVLPLEPLLLAVDPLMVQIIYDHLSLLDVGVLADSVNRHQMIAYVYDILVDLVGLSLLALFLFAFFRLKALQYFQG